MSWKPGETVKVRSNKTATIVAVLEEPLWNGHTIVATVGGHIWTYHSDGAVQLGTSTLDDLVGDNPVVRMMWVNVHMNRSSDFGADTDGLIGRAYVTRNAADVGADQLNRKTRVACVPVSFEEGEGV